MIFCRSETVDETIRNVELPNMQIMFCTKRATLIWQDVSLREKYTAS